MMRIRQAGLSSCSLADISGSETGSEVHDRSAGFSGFSVIFPEYRKYYMKIQSIFSRISIYCCNFKQEI